MYVSLYMRTVCTVVVGYAYCQLIQCHGLWHHEVVYVRTCTTACDCMCCHDVPACPLHSKHHVRTYIYLFHKLSFFYHCIYRQQVVVV